MIVDSQSWLKIFNHPDSGNQVLSDMDSLITHSHKRPPWGSWRSKPAETSKTINRSTLYIQWTLKINSKLQFKLHSISALKQEISSDLINSLDELAKGSCVSQSSLEQSPESHSGNKFSNQIMAITTNPLNRSSRN